MCIWYKSIQTLVEEIACDENTATFRFTIRDTGIGMSEDFVNNELFEPFTQEKQGARTQYQGTGLGMSIVKELIEKMNGTITVESVLGEGSAFTVTLPFEIDKHPSAQAADSWKCACGMVVNGNFCPNCGAKKPDNDGWTCSCGKVNKGNFCANCGAKKPEGLPKYRCDKCGWEPEDPAHPPKFCPQCGDPFDENDRA